MNDKNKDPETKSKEIIQIIEPNKELLFLKSKLLPYGGSIMHMLAYGEPRVNSRGQTVGCLKPTMFKGVMTQIVQFLSENRPLQKYMRQFEKEMDETVDDEGNTVAGAAYLCNNSPMMNLLADIMDNERFPRVLVMNKEYTQQADGSFAATGSGRHRRKTLRRKRTTRKRKASKRGGVKILSMRKFAAVVESLFDELGLSVHGSNFEDYYGAYRELGMAKFIKMLSREEGMSESDISDKLNFDSLD